ncbi:MAG: DUF2961 domain-containing protein [Pirellulaceae bacterium]|nr:DUF2961 domain-containing protein [Pirellulaceae bacterium]
MKRCAMPWLCLVCLLCLLVGRRAATADELSFADLVHRMVDLERLAHLPQAGERGAMWSSYDRASQFDEPTGKYVKWHANGDGTGLIRREGQSEVIAEMDGPGVIWRIWSARPEQGHVRIEIDGQTAVDMPFAHYFDAAHPPFDYATLGYEASKGWNLYFPIPYQNSCRILAQPGWGRYYQITYATYPSDTKLPALSDATSPESVAALKRIDDIFARRLGTDPRESREGQETHRHKAVDIPAGTSWTVAKLDGPAAITALKIRMDFKDREDQMAALRRLALRITWDDSKRPAVWCPLGDFFGTAPGVNLYRSLPLGMTEDGFYSYWYMPFASSAVVELVNEDETPRTVSAEITTAPLTVPVEKLARFHAKWHRDLTSVPEDRWPDWTVLEAQGRGRFCGMMLHAWNPRGGQCEEVKWCNGHYWWGEGDEKFFVDGERFPSTFGTGTEDYFGYAWCHPALFHRPFHNQTMTENNSGHQSVNRFQIADNVPFQQSFDASLEKYFPNDYPTLYAATAYWYLSADGTDSLGPVPVEQRHGYYVRPPVRYGSYEVIEPVAGRVQIQSMTNWPPHKWQNGNQLWWTQAQPGDKLQLRIPVETTGRYQVRALLTKARDYGIVQLSLDGRKLGEPIDLYNPEVVPTGAIDLGQHDVQAGDRVLTIEIVGTNPRAVKSYMFGLDVLQFDPVE